MDIHNYERRYLCGIEQIKKSGLSAKNKKLIFLFLDFLILENLSKPRLIKYLNTLKLIAIRLGKDFDVAEVTDIKRLICEIQQANYSPWTKQAYKVIVRKFYKWLKKTKDYPPIVDWINIRIRKSERKLPAEGDLLSEDDIKKLLRACNHPRDRAFVSILWESGSRISEIGNLELRHVSFDSYGAVITVNGKTGSRQIRLIFSTPYLSTWMDNHPLRESKSSKLWVNIGNTNRHKPWTYSSMRILLKRLFASAGINKRFNPHLFRHSRASYMANFLTEFQMNKFFGWIQGSNMPSVYVHLSGKDIDNAILAMNGLSLTKEEKKAELIPLICPRCDTLNNNMSKHCTKCGGILDLKHAMEIEAEHQKVQADRLNSDKIISLLLQDKNLQEILMEKLKNLTPNLES